MVESHRTNSKALGKLYSPLEIYNKNRGKILRPNELTNEHPKNHIFGKTHPKQVLHLLEKLPTHSNYMILEVNA